MGVRTAKFGQYFSVIIQVSRGKGNHIRPDGHPANSYDQDKNWPRTDTQRPLQEKTICLQGHWVLFRRARGR